MFWNILTCLLVCSIFKNVPKLSICSETFRFALGTFQKCSGTLRHFQKYSETFWLVYCLVFLMFRNFQFISKHADLFSDTFKFGLKTFQKFIFGTFQKCSTILRYFSKVFWNILTCLVNCSAFKIFRNFQFTPKHSDLFWEHFKNVLKFFQDCSNTFRFVFGTFRKCSEY